MIKINIFDFLKSKNKPTLINKDYQQNIQLWKSWYKGKVDNFHSYLEQVGDGLIKCEKASFMGAEMVSKDWAKLLINENFKFSVESSKAQNVLDQVLKDINFLNQGNKLMELTFAMGTGATVQYLDKNLKVRQKYIRAEMIYPLSYEGGEITECAFASNINKLGQQYLYVETHTKDSKDMYVVDNFVLKVDQNTKTLTEVTQQFNLLPKWETNSTIPCFQIYKPNIVNVYDFDSPMGCSIFGNAIDNLKGVDTVFDSYINEFILGIKRVYVSDGALEWVTTPDGRRIPKANMDSKVMRYVPFDGDLIQQVDFNLRVQEHNLAMQDQLNFLSSKCGLGVNHFKYNAGGATTATEIISSNSEKYKSMVMHQNGLVKPLTDMALKILELNNIKNVEVTPVFDDSIIEDTKTERENAQKEVADGLRSIKSYLTDAEVGRGLSEEEAEEEIKLIKDDKVIDFVGGDEGVGIQPEENVGDNKNKTENI